MSPKKSLKETAQTNPTLLGDPTSLKPESSSSPSTTSPSKTPTPTEQDMENNNPPSSSPSSSSSSSSSTQTQTPTPTEHDLEPPPSSSPHRPIPPSSTTPHQGPTGTPTQRKSAKPDGAGPGDGRGSLKEAAMKNPSLLGDPVSLKAESSEYIPRPEEGGAKGEDETEGEGRLRAKI